MICPLEFGSDLDTVTCLVSDSLCEVYLLKFLTTIILLINFNFYYNIFDEPVTYSVNADYNKR